MNLAEYLALFLKRQGVSYLFGLPGGENVTVIEALRQAGIEYVLVHHEATASYAADVTGQLTDRPGICMSTAGPGAANLAAAAAAATLERSPVLALTADIDLGRRARISHMKLDLVALFGAVTKGSFALRPETAPEILAHAWRLALAPPRGAVHLALPPDLALGTMPDSADPEPVEIPKSLPSDGLSALRPYLLGAREPFIVAGLGLEAAGAQAELLALAESWDAPVAVTPKAKGHFPESHGLFAGCLTAYGDQPLRQALAEADLILGVGLDGVDLVTLTWDVPTPVINLSGGGADDPVIRPMMALDGDLRGMLRRLLNEEGLLAGSQMRRQAAGGQAGPVRAKDLRQAIANKLVTPAVRLMSGTIALGDLTAALRAALPAEGAVTVDVGAFKLVFLQAWSTDLPKSLFVANGLSAMGYAIPAALASRKAQPERPVVALAGDGALLMYAGELATVGRLGQPLVVMVIVDEALALIRLKQERQALPVHGTEFGRSDYASLAASFGLGYRLIDGQGQAQATLAEALAQPGPVLVEARIDKAEYGRFR